MNNTKQIPKYHSQFHPHSTIEYHFIITYNWAAMVKSTGQGMYKTGRIVPVGWHRSACCKWRQNMCRGKTAPAPPFSITQDRIKGAQVHMAVREDLCFRMKNLHKTNKELFGATAASKDCPRNQGMWIRECRGCLPLTRPSGCRSFCFLLLQYKKWHVAENKVSKMSGLLAWLLLVPACLMVSIALPVSGSTTVESVSLYGPWYLKVI